MSGNMNAMKANGMTDEQLLSRFLKGDEEGLADLANRYEPLLLGLARGLLDGRNDLACDAVQETWIKVLRYGSSFNGSSRFKTWIYRIAINQCKNIRKARRRDEPLPESENETSTTDSNHTDDPNEDLRQALRDLDQAKADVILLCYHQGMTHERAADILRIPVGTLKSRLHAALKELREALTPELIA